jgi:hypothetical protein
LFVHQQPSRNSQGRLGHFGGQKSDEAASIFHFSFSPEIYLQFFVQLFLHLLLQNQVDEHEEDGVGICLLQRHRIERLNYLLKWDCTHIGGNEEVKAHGTQRFHAGWKIAQFSKIFLLPHLK